MLRFLPTRKRGLSPASQELRMNVGMPEREILGLSDGQMYPATPLWRLDMIVRDEPGLVTRQTPIGSIGNCFLAEIRRWLISRRFNYIQAEQGAGSEHGSARFGFVYNTACLRQCFEFAYGRFTPTHRWWSHRGMLLDPYRKGIAWPDESTAIADLESHARAVRRMVEATHVLFVTAGLAEVWRNRRDGATFFQVPPHEIFDPALHEFTLTTAQENLANLQTTHALLRQHNPTMRLVIMLSPVPLRATFRKDITCLEADAVSKAILRIAIDQFCSANKDVIYFPAYEIAKRLVPRPFLADNRHVQKRVIDRIMTTFMRHYG